MPIKVISLSLYPILPETAFTKVTTCVNMHCIYGFIQINRLSRFMLRTRQTVFASRSTKKSVLHVSRTHLWNVSRTACSLAPMYLFKSSGPFILIKFNPISLAMTEAISVLPVPGAPYNNTPDCSRIGHCAYNCRYCNRTRIHAMSFDWPLQDCFCNFTAVIGNMHMKIHCHMMVNEGRGISMRECCKKRPGRK